MNDGRRDGRAAGVFHPPDVVEVGAAALLCLAVVLLLLRPPRAIESRLCGILGFLLRRMLLLEVAELPFDPGRVALRSLEIAASLPQL